VLSDKEYQNNRKFIKLRDEFRGKPEEKRHWGDPDVYGRIILR
jgi:hypothetical protein